MKISRTAVCVCTGVFALGTVCIPAAAAAAPRAIAATTALKGGLNDLNALCAP